MRQLKVPIFYPSLQNHKLHIENGLLREKSSGLVTENEELRQRLGLNALETKESVSIQDGTLLNQSKGSVGGPAQSMFQRPPSCLFLRSRSWSRGPVGTRQV